jgi:hypothetical protein
MRIVPRLPPAQDHFLEKFSAIVSKEEGMGSSYLYVLGESTEEAEKSTMRVYMLQDGVWCMHTSATCTHDVLISFAKKLSSSVTKSICQPPVVMTLLCWI